MTDQEFSEALDKLVDEALAAGIETAFIAAELMGIADGLPADE